jgi:hypothetical protein
MTSAQKKMLRYVTLRYVTLRYVTLRYVTLRYDTYGWSGKQILIGSVNGSWLVSNNYVLRPRPSHYIQMLINGKICIQSHMCIGYCDQLCCLTVDVQPVFNLTLYIRPSHIRELKQNWRQRMTKDCQIKPPHRLTWLPIFRKNPSSCPDDVMSG